MSTKTNATPLTLEGTLHFARAGRGGRKEGRQGPKPATPSGRVPRVARLMALALRFEGLIAQGVVTDYAELARLGHVTRARVTQVMNLLHLAPDIQEQFLFLPAVERGRDPLALRDLQPLAMMLDWKKQRRAWSALSAKLPQERASS